jgi:hypothetical protein
VATVLLLDQARLHTVLACHGQQPGAGNQGLEARDCLAHQQGLLVPVAAHELGSGKPAQQGKRCVGVHEMVRSERRDRAALSYAGIALSWRQRKLPRNGFVAVSRPACAWP